MLHSVMNQINDEKINVRKNEGNLNMEGYMLCVMKNIWC